MFPKNGRANIVTADAEIVCDRSRELKRILLGAYADDPMAIRLFGQDLDSKLDRIADYDEDRARQPRCALLRDPAEDWEVGVR